MLESQPVIFHVFSNGGGMVYRHISEILHGIGPDSTQAQQDMECFRDIVVIGTIFDSCPGQRNIFVAVKAFMLSMPESNAFVRYTAGARLFLFIIFKSMISFFWRSIFLMGKNRHNYFVGIQNDPAKWPCLYLYSRSDKLIDYNVVDKMIAKKLSQGVDVSSMCWQNSAHVAHFRQYRDAYIMQCYTFLDMCLAKNY